MPAPDVSVVVVSYDTRSFLVRCLRAVSGRELEVVVVDNGSSDGSPAMVRREFPRARLLELRENLGFGGAANRGIEAAGASDVLLLNPDAWPRDDEALHALIACAAAWPDAGVLGPSLVGPDGAAQVSHIGMPTRWWTGTPAVSAARPGRLARRRLHPRARGEAFLVGAALLLRREALEQVGAFDDDFFMYGEEVDLCRRMLRAGWGVRLCSRAVFVHVGGASTRPLRPAMHREQLRSHLRLLAKHEGLDRSERARRYLMVVLRLRAALAGGVDRTLYRDTASWLRSADAASLIARSVRDPHRTGAAEDRAGGGDD